MSEQTPQEPQEVSAGYLLCMTPREETLRFPEFGNQYFITAKHPGEGEDAITSAGVNFTSKTMATDEGIKLTGNISLAKQFIEKCMQQITDFCLPADTGDIRYERQDSKRRKVYVCLLASPARKEIEEFLDIVAGRDDATQRDLADLGEE